MILCKKEFEYVLISQEETHQINLPILLENGAMFVAEHGNFVVSSYFFKNTPELGNSEHEIGVYCTKLNDEESFVFARNE